MGQMANYPEFELMTDELLHRIQGFSGAPGNLAADTRLSTDAAQDGRLLLLDQAEDEYFDYLTYWHNQQQGTDSV